MQECIVPSYDLAVMYTAMQAAWSPQCIVKKLARGNYLAGLTVAPPSSGTHQLQLPVQLLQLLLLPLLLLLLFWPLK